jgi:hypothetical protein
VPHQLITQLPDEAVAAEATDISDEIMGKPRLPCDGHRSLPDPRPPRRHLDYQWDIDTSGGRPEYGNRLHKQPYGTSPAISTELGTWKPETSDLPLYSRKDMMLAPELDGVEGADDG